MSNNPVRRQLSCTTSVMFDVSKEFIESKHTRATTKCDKVNLKF